MPLASPAATPGDLRAAFDGSRALVTGGVGLIGSALARSLVELGASVTIIDASLPESGANLRNIESIRERVQLALVDVRATDQLPGHRGLAVRPGRRGARECYGHCCRLE